MTDLEYRNLKKKSLDELRAMAHQFSEGVSLLKREQIIELLCKNLGISKTVHAEGLDVGAVKRQIKDLKTQRQSHLEAKDAKALKRTRRHIHALKRKIRRAAVETARHAGH